MRRTRGWAGLRPAVFALGFVAATAGGARADAISSSSNNGNKAVTAASPLIGYNTIGSAVATTGVSGNPLVTFVPVSGSFQSPTNLSFGKFQVAAPSDGATTTYSNTPFSIVLGANSVNGNTSVTPNDTFKVTGVLNGTVNSQYQTDLTATFDPLATTDFQTGLYKHTISLPDSPLRLVPSATNDGLTSVQARVTSQTVVAAPVPEPSTLALFGATLAGLGFRRRMLRRKAEAA